MYSCEYQSTVNDLLHYCIKPDFDNIPFCPPLDDAKAGCPFNISKIIRVDFRTSEEADSTCGIDAPDQAPSNDEVQDILQGCICCTNSAYLSAYVTP